MYSFPIGAITNNHQLGDLKQGVFIFSHVSRSEVRNQFTEWKSRYYQGHVFSGKGTSENLSIAPFSFWWLLVFHYMIRLCCRIEYNMSMAKVSRQVGLRQGINECMMGACWEQMTHTPDSRGERDHSSSIPCHTYVAHGCNLHTFLPEAVVEPLPWPWNKGSWGHAYGLPTHTSLAVQEKFTCAPYWGKRIVLYSLVLSSSRAVQFVIVPEHPVLRTKVLGTLGRCQAALGLFPQSWHSFTCGPISLFLLITLCPLLLVSNLYPLF